MCDDIERDIRRRFCGSGNEVSERVGLGAADGRTGESMTSGDIFGVFDPDKLKRELV
jgi:hypothetical protein